MLYSILHMVLLTYTYNSMGMVCLVDGRDVHAACGWRWVSLHIHIPCCRVPRNPKVKVVVDDYNPQTLCAAGQMDLQIYSAELLSSRVSRASDSLRYRYSANRYLLCEQAPLSYQSFDLERLGKFHDWLVVLEFGKRCNFDKRSRDWYACMYVPGYSCMAVWICRCVWIWMYVNMDTRFWKQRDGAQDRQIRTRKDHVSGHQPCSDPDHTCNNICLPFVQEKVVNTYHISQWGVGDVRDNNCHLREKLHQG